MTLIPFILLLVGLLLVFLEFFFPGGILGGAAALILIGSIVFFAIESTSILWTLVYIAAVAGAVVIVIWFTMRRIKSGKFKGIYLNSEQTGYVASEYAKELIGKEGKAVTDLKPAGHIMVDGKRYQAMSISGYIEKESPIIVTGGDGAHLKVKSKTA